MIIETTSKEQCDYCSEIIQDSHHVLWLLATNRRLHLHPDCSCHLGNKLKRNQLYWQHQQESRKGAEQPCS